MTFSQFVSSCGTVTLMDFLFHFIYLLIVFVTMLTQIKTIRAMVLQLSLFRDVVNCIIHEE